MKKILALLSVGLLAAQTLMAQPLLMDFSDKTKYSIVYELNGGINNSANPIGYAENATVMLKDPTRENYKFDGWYWDADFKNKLENSTFSQKTEPIRVYAKWTWRQLLTTNPELANFESENMVVIIPAGQKVLLEDFAGTSGLQNIFSYSISKYEVTQDLFFTVMSFNPSRFKEGADAGTRPVENLTWYDAVMFCNELTKSTMGENYCCYTITDIKKNEKGNITSANVIRDESKKGYRLPTEAEWEMAARGGVKGGWSYSYAGSYEIEDVAWYDKNSKNTTHKLGTKKPNAAGLYDMSGNVREWCDNTWSQDSSDRVHRGGSWSGSYGGCSVSNRNGNYPDYAYRHLGFRVCRSL